MVHLVNRHKAPLKTGMVNVTHSSRPHHHFNSSNSNPFPVRIPVPAPTDNLQLRVRLVLEFQYHRLIKSNQWLAALAPGTRNSSGHPLSPKYQLNSTPSDPVLHPNNVYHTLVPPSLKPSSNNNIDIQYGSVK